MAVGSDVLALLSLVCISFFALMALRYYLPLRTTPQYLLVPVFLALVVPCSIIILVPIDLASTSRSDGAEGSRGVVLPTSVLTVSWRISYWLCFVLTWAMLPILQAFCDSGYRSPQKRFYESLRENLKFYGVMLILGILGFLYLIFRAGVSLSNIKGLVMSLSYCYALLLAVYLMGHGLVAIPRQLFRDAVISGRLRRLQKKAPRVHDDLQQATEKLEEVEREVMAVKRKCHNAPLEFQEWAEELVDTLQLPESSLQNSAAFSASARSRSRSPMPDVISEQYLASLTRRLRLAAHKRARYSAEWDTLVRTAMDTQAVLDSAGQKKLVFRPNPHSVIPWFNKLSLLPPYVRFVLHYHMLPWMRRALGAFLVCLSAGVLWSEIIHVNGTLVNKLSIIGLSVVHHPSSDIGTVGFAGQCISAMWIGYMCIAAYNSLSDIKLWGSYALVRRRTAGSAACFYASYACRLTVPLSFNFLEFLPADTKKGSAFYKFLGQHITLTQGFNTWFPILVLIPVCATLFNLYSRAKDYLGFGYDLIDDEEEGLFGLTGGWREGRDLIDREIGGTNSAPILPRAGTGSTARGSAPQRDAEYRDLIGNSPTLLSPQRPLSPQGGVTAAQSQSRTLPSRSTVPTASSQRVRDARLDTGIQPPTRSDEEEEEEGAFEAFFHRVKNTIDTTDKPKWMNDALKKPKWMNPDNEGVGGSSNSAGSSSGSALTKPKWLKGIFGDDDD